MKHIDILDSWKTVKFITDLHKHKNSIKGDFGHVKELESLISRDLETRRLKFDNLVSIANCIFTNNLCSNKIQSLVENELIDRISDFGHTGFDMAKFIKLIKSLPGYYIKNELLCDKIKNVLETYLNAYLKHEKEYEQKSPQKYRNQAQVTYPSDEELNEKNRKNNKINKSIYMKIPDQDVGKIEKNDTIENKIIKMSNAERSEAHLNGKPNRRKSQKSDYEEELEEEPEIIVENIDVAELEENMKNTISNKTKNINYEFMEKYNKIISNVSLIFWALSKNQKFKSLTETREDFKYFFDRMKEITLKNIEFYNEREITFILKGLKELNIPITKSENNRFVKKISSMENFTLHDRVVLLSMFLKHNFAGSLELILKFIEKINKNFQELTFSDLIQYLELIALVPSLIQKFFAEKNFERIAFIEKRFTPILSSIDIDKFSRLYLIISNFHNFFSEGFLENTNKILENRINEIPKEYFPKILFNVVNYSVYSVAPKLFDILEDLSHFENIKENFLKFEDLNYLLWSALTFCKNSKSLLILENQQEYDIEKQDDEHNQTSINKKLLTFVKSLINSLIGIDSICSPINEGTGNITNKLIISTDEVLTYSGLEEKYKELSEKIIKFIQENFNVKAFESLSFQKKSSDQNEKNDSDKTNNTFDPDRNNSIIIYFQTIQLLLEYIKANLYYNLKNERIPSELIDKIQVTNNNKGILNKSTNSINKELKFNKVQEIQKVLVKSFDHLRENTLLELSESSIRSDISILDNFVLNDVASSNDKNLVNEIILNIDSFFAKKSNCSIYHNVIDDYFNAINVTIVFEKPELKEDEYILGIDANQYAVLLINNNYFSKIKTTTGHKQKIKFYENRINLLSQFFDWKIILINNNEWRDDLDKQEYLKQKFGYDMQDAENIHIKILNKNDISESNNMLKDDRSSTNNEDNKNEKFEVKPKYNLTKSIIDKKHIGKNKK